MNAFFKGHPRQPGCQTSLALFSSWTRAWPKKIVGKALREEPWHCWAVARVKSAKSKGKHLIIWDCDATSREGLGSKRWCNLLGV